MEQSKLVYEIDILDSTQGSIDTPQVLGNSLVLRATENGTTLFAVSLSEGAAQAFSAAEGAYKDKRYDTAFALYKRALELQPEFVPALTYMGDVRFAQNRFDEARALFLQSIDSNFVDYDAHWFLADTYAHLLMPDSATLQYTIAHLLNRNHALLKKTLESHRSDIGRPWKEWDFRPVYRLSRSGHRVTVKADSNWIGYAMVKALWQYEPGYADSMLGPGHEQPAFNFQEEKEALLAYLALHENAEPLSQIISDGFVTEFLLYELAGPKLPGALLLLPRDTFNRIVEYVEKYH